jgi:DNA-binding response OmpR family regulator
MTGRVDERVGRPFGFVLSEDEDQRERICRSLSSEGIDVLAFLDVGSAQAWLDEETPEVAIVDGAAGRGFEIVAEILEARGVRMMSIA